MDRLGLVTLHISGLSVRSRSARFSGKVEFRDSILLQQIRDEERGGCADVSDGHRLDKKTDHTYEGVKSAFYKTAIGISIWKKSTGPISSLKSWGSKARSGVPAYSASGFRGLYFGGTGHGSVLSWHVLLHDVVEDTRR